MTVIGGGTGDVSDDGVVLTLGFGGSTGATLADLGRGGPIGGLGGGVGFATGAVTDLSSAGNLGAVASTP